MMPRIAVDNSSGCPSSTKVSPLSEILTNSARDEAGCLVMFSTRSGLRASKNCRARTLISA